MQQQDLLQVHLLPFSHSSCLLHVHSVLWLVKLHVLHCSTATAASSGNTGPKLLLSLSCTYSCLAVGTVVVPACAKELALLHWTLLTLLTLQLCDGPDAPFQMGGEQSSELLSRASCIDIDSCHVVLSVLCVVAACLLPEGKSTSPSTPMQLLCQCHKVTCCSSSCSGNHCSAQCKLDLVQSTTIPQHVCTRDLDRLLSSFDDTWTLQI